MSLIVVLEQANAPEYIDFHNISLNDGADKFFDINPETSNENNKNIINTIESKVDQVNINDNLKNSDKDSVKELSNAVKKLNIEIKTSTDILKKRNAEATIQKNHVSKYIPVAEQVLRFQKSTPKRFRAQPSGGKYKNPLKIKNITTPKTTTRNDNQLIKSSSRVKHIVKTVQYKDGIVTLADYEVTNFGVPKSKKQNLTSFANVPNRLFERHEQAKAKKEEMMKRLQTEQTVKTFKAKPAPKFAPPSVRVNSVSKLTTASKKFESAESLPSKSLIPQNIRNQNKTIPMASNQNKPVVRFKGAPILSTAERQRFHLANEQARIDRARQIQEKKDRLRIEREQEEIEKARREASSFKAKPAPKFKKPFLVRPANKELTTPKQPNFIKK